jgi:hypothetical protein
MIADKIVFLIFMPQFSSAQAASQETLGSGRCGDLAMVRIANFFAPSKDTGWTRAVPEDSGLRLSDSFE